MVFELIVELEERGVMRRNCRNVSCRGAAKSKRGSIHVISLGIISS